MVSSSKGSTKYQWNQPLIENIRQNPTTFMHFLSITPEQYGYRMADTLC